ncbi:LysR substrate-binding domain-containing protein [Streptomyces gobiensis]|uniref:LysR substrate-binding domain-containing protein n=1 Tax=Streptomyces gobiensis TaxID=2875706 RepID=UPI001E455DE7|nr:LysR substrate-binding domain-containing protein [Streptomyces gobiensis]UGY90779.1 LysR family transcriptional regulator [Streptomyces gobiensis]
MSLDLRKIEHFMAVVEELGFTPAAARLHLSQQALSTSIRALEREVGVDLLDRSGGQVSVLPAGRALYEDARVVRALADAALKRARRTGRGEAEALRIGRTPAVTGEEVTALAGRLRSSHPEVRVRVDQRYPSELAGLLLAGELDLALGRALAPVRGLTVRTLARQPLGVAVRAGHRLSGRAAVALGDLAGERLMVWGRPGRSGYTDLLLAECRRAGWEPELEINPVQGTPPVTAVLDNDCVALVTAPLGAAGGGDVVVIALDPPVGVPLQAMWLEHASSEARDAFVAAASE